ncbi:hypothetical protein CORC01_07240 [Colletotrichum orchidophilum]|uniref:Uncharacterized protein n=1 Tax=Colletotrichum orchidophilum TaxID=1209926 RepID=A0A1G4B7M9_9PEZI|nr:hypothetical protein CORC01_07240 [Colletotrichum orchidophilum]
MPAWQRNRNGTSARLQATSAPAIT